MDHELIAVTLVLLVIAGYVMLAFRLLANAFFSNSVNATSLTSLNRTDF